MPENNLNINGNLSYSKEKILKIAEGMDIDKVTMSGIYDSLSEMKPEIEKIYNINFILGYIVEDAPYFGWRGDKHTNMRKIEDEISKKLMELYAIILLGLGEIDNNQ